MSLNKLTDRSTVNCRSPLQYKLNYLFTDVQQVLLSSSEWSCLLPFTARRRCGSLVDTMELIIRLRFCRRLNFGRCRRSPDNDQLVSWINAYRHQTSRCLRLIHLSPSAFEHGTRGISDRCVPIVGDSIRMRKSGRADSMSI